nr:immunoglobulin light chain junction region [Macaca mulatta]
CQKYNNLPFTF